MVEEHVGMVALLTHVGCRCQVYADKAVAQLNVGVQHPVGQSCRHAGAVYVMSFQLSVV